ncbi:hypothetical protein LCGC14_2232050 [marine sediment metagenome]|uniref:Uncharacterized protein n=1 Tax=marine sediment metagenome TaxID=412755 RepID=A0A0F9FKJ9_9ZZZZ
MGPKLAIAHTTASMTNASAAALALNNDRKYALIVNDGAVDVYLNLGGTAVANQGIRVNANGSSYEMSRNEGNLFDGVINGITASGTATLIVTEGT